MWKNIGSIILLISELSFGGLSLYMCLEKFLGVWGG